MQSRITERNKKRNKIKKKIIKIKIVIAQLPTQKWAYLS